MTKFYRPVGAKTLWPIGAVYISINSVNPATLFGGTWAQIKGNYLMAFDPDSSMQHKDVNITVGNWWYNTGYTQLTAAQSGLPYHSHSYNTPRWYWSESAGGGDVIGEQSTTSYMFTREVGGTGGWSASEGHLHPLQSVYPCPATTLNVWYRVA